MYLWSFTSNCDLNVGIQDDQADQLEVSGWTGEVPNTKTMQQQRVGRQRANMALMRACSAGTTSFSNQACCLSQGWLRGEGCGSGMNRGAYSRQATVVSVSEGLRWLPRKWCCAY